MNRFLISFTILLLFVSACYNASEDRRDVIATDSVCVDSSCYAQDTLQLFEEEVLPESADELFNDFFFNYTSDMNFKNQRQAYSLDCNIGDTVIKIHSSELGAYSELFVDDYYSIIYERNEDLSFQKDTSLNEVIVERSPRCRDPAGPWSGRGDCRCAGCVPPPKPSPPGCRHRRLWHRRSSHPG